MVQPPICASLLTFPSQPGVPCDKGSYHRVDSRVDAEGGVLGGEGFACGRDEEGVPGARPPLGDVVHAGLAAQGRVVGATGGQEVGGLVSCDHLASVGKDGGGEDAKGIDPWE